MKSNVKVLYIDDEPLNLRLIRKTLNHMGYEVIDTMDVEAGLSLAETQKPDVVLLDLHMPCISGIDAAKWLRAHPELRHIPLIALTADTRDTIRDEALDAGFDAYLLKPISRGQLLKTLQQTISAKTARCTAQ